jgi:hypothetical protein
LQTPTPAYRQFTTVAPGVPDAPAAARALLLELLATCPTLEAFVDAAAGRLPLVALCTPDLNGPGCVQSHWRRGRDGREWIPGSACEKPGKQPLVSWKQYQAGPPATAAEVARWRREYPSANWGLAAGPRSGIVLFDQDDNPAPLELPPTAGQRTGRPGGRHHWLAYPEGVRLKNTVGFRPGWDLRAEGGLLMLPGCLHASGRRYELDRASLAHGCAPIPADLLTTLVAPPRPSAEKLASGDANSGQTAAVTGATILDGIPAGQRHAALVSYAGKLRAAAVPLPDAVELVAKAAARCTPPYTDEEPADLVADVYGRYAAGFAPQADDSPTVLRLRAQVDQLQAENAELRQERAALLEENRELRRQEPRKALRRLVQNVADLERDQSTRGIAWPLLALLSERQDRMEAGEPGDTTIPWNGAERCKQLGRSVVHLRTKFITPLENAGIVHRHYDERGQGAADGNWCRDLSLQVVADLPDDLADQVQAVYREVKQPPKERKKRDKQGCKVCPTAQCSHCGSTRVRSQVLPICADCYDRDHEARPAGVEHLHQPRRTQGAAAAVAVQHFAPVPIRPDANKICRAETTTKLPTNFVRFPNGEALDGMMARLDQLDPILKPLADRLPPVEGAQLRTLALAAIQAEYGIPLAAGAAE